MFKDALSKLNFDVKIRAEASISALSYVDLMIEDFKKRTAINKADVLLDVFGLLQGLFVGIDSLYQLSISITKYKYHININENDVLRQLKFVRNDVVGHPTNRSYTDGSYGFSIILDDEINKDNLSYITYVIKNNDISNRRTDVNFNEVIKAYETAKKEVISNIEDFLNRRPSKLDISGFIVSMYEKGQQNIFDKKDIETLNEMIKDDQNLKKGSTNRFNYHVKGLSKLYDIHDIKYKDVLTYLKLREMLKIYRMYLDLNDKKIRIPVLSFPDTLTNIKDDLCKNITLNDFNVILNDKYGLHAETRLKTLLNDLKTNEAKDYIAWFMKISDSQQSYLIAKSIQELLK